MSSVPQVVSEDIIAIGQGRYAHFRRDQRFVQVQAIFTAPAGVDPNPGRELTDSFKELGWTWRMNEPGKPWIYQLDKSFPDDPTARGDSRDVLHEQFVIIVQEYRQKHGLPPTIGWQGLSEGDTKPRNDDRRRSPGSSVATSASSICEDKRPPSKKRETRGGGPTAEMLDAFASAGAQRFDLTFTDATGEKVDFRGNRTLEQLRLASFLILRTSPSNFQACVAVADGDADFARRLKKGTGGDLAASGATHVSGSLNAKEMYSPALPRIETIHTSYGLVVTRAKLEALGVTTPPEKDASATISSARPRTDAGG